MSDPRGGLAAVRRALVEFMVLPGSMMLGFLVLAVVTYFLDKTPIPVLQPVRDWMETHVFGDSDSTSALLETIAGSVITVTSITLSLLLLAVQQAAGSLTTQIIDQFLRRKLNQAYFGFFLGLAVYALLTLATVNPPFNPVYGATLTLLLTLVALLFLLALLYTTINQMRPAVVIDAIREHVLAARERQLEILDRTRRFSTMAQTEKLDVTSEVTGFVIGLDLDGMAGALRDDAEITLEVSMGSFVGFGDVIARVHGPLPSDTDALIAGLRDAVHLERRRDLASDPGYGLQQLEAIAWTSISTSKQNPAPGRQTVQALRDIIGRWSLDEPRPTDTEVLPIVYTDGAFEELLATLESLGVATTESMQHQVAAEVFRTFAVTLARIPARHRPRAEDVILRLLTGLGDHVLTAELESSLASVAKALDETGASTTAASVRAATEQLARTVGRLNARSTRVGA